MFSPTYFDHNATTPLDPVVLAAMLPYLREQYGNASSRHEYGRAARRAVDEARAQVAAAVGAHPTEVLFTSGGSEANNLFIKGAAACLKPGALAVGATEHPCVLKPAGQLIKQGWQLHTLAVDDQGAIDPADFELALARSPKQVSIMLANNETGVCQDIAPLAHRARTAGALFHTDAVQALGKMPVDFRQLGVQAMTVSSHKLGGPKGAAALIIDKRVELLPQIAGGGHERGLRSGTENVPAIVGFGLACELALQKRVNHSAQCLKLREQLENGLHALGATLFSRAAQRLPNTTYFAFAAIDGETLVGRLDREGYALASGAACSSANPEPSHVLRAMGVAPEVARGAIRVSLGASNTAQQITDFLLVLQNTLAALQRLTAIAV